MINYHTHNGPIPSWTIPRLVLDFDYNTAKRAHATVLSAIEERRAIWEDIIHINLIRTQYSHKVIVHLPGKASIALIIILVEIMYKTVMLNHVES